MSVLQFPGRQPVLSLPLDRAHVMEQLARLLRMFKRPEHASPNDEEFATDYAQICGELRPEQFTGAVDAYLQGPTRYFPKAGELLALGRLTARASGQAGGLEGQYQEWEQNAWQDPATGRWTPCPVCDARMQEHLCAIRPDGTEVYRLRILHNAAVHWKAGIAFSMSAAAGTGGGRYEHKVNDMRPPVAPTSAPSDEQLERQAIAEEEQT